MKVRVSIDVGLNALGFAVWRNSSWARLEAPLWADVISVPGKLKEATARGVEWIRRLVYLTCRLEQDVLSEYTLQTMYMEWPQFHGTAVGLAVAARGNLSQLACAAGFHAWQAESLGAEAVLVPVSTWKGMLKKDIVEVRIHRAIGNVDARNHEFKSHAVDAVGIGLVMKGFPFTSSVYADTGL